MSALRRNALLRSVAFCALILCGAVFATPLFALDAPENFQRGCEAKNFVLRSDFPGGRVSRCSVQDAAHVEVWIAPEDAPPINDSAWYAFRLEPRAPGTATITLRYENGTHRYLPKIHRLTLGADADAGVSAASEHWRVLPDVEALGDSAVRLRVALRDAPVLIAAQELLLPRDYESWQAQLAGHPAFRRTGLGTSSLGRPLVHIELGRGDAGSVVLLGRQHPPEVTGAFALFAFVLRLTEADALATTFLERFRVHLFPLLNPDGVVRGHWRNGAGGVDLNRDWGVFTQPETARVHALLSEEFARRAPLLMLDFHSTRRDVLYTQLDAEATRPEGFHRAWFACLAAHAPERLAGAPFAPRSPRRTGTQANAKNYFHHRYGIPTATYEAGDETPRRAIRAHARAFAEAMMRTLLRADGCGAGARPGAE